MGIHFLQSFKTLLILTHYKFNMKNPKSLIMNQHINFRYNSEVYNFNRLVKNREKPSSAAPDLPSLLLENRIVYIGMPLVSIVTELIIAELLYLQYRDQHKPITMYINSTGCI